MSDTSGGSPAAASNTTSPAQRTTIRDLAPWGVLSMVALLGIATHWAGADPSVLQLLSTIAGVCGGALMPRRSSGETTTTVTAGDPPSAEVKS